MLQNNELSSFCMVVSSSDAISNTVQQFCNISGIYIFIEASQRSSGDRARLISDWLIPKEPACLQFWYHMHGRHIGALNIFLKTKRSEITVWQEGSRDHGDRWIFAQTTIQNDNSYKV